MGRKTSGLNLLNRDESGVAQDKIAPVFHCGDGFFISRDQESMEAAEIKNVIIKYRKIITGSLVMLFIITLIYFINEHTGINKVKLVSFQTKTKKENTNPLGRNKVVTTFIHMGAGHNDSLGLVLASPYTNKEQESQLYRYSTQIKNDFLLVVSEEDLKKWISNRDFDDIKTTFRKIVNQYLDEPVSEVYISSYFYE